MAYVKTDVPIYHVSWSINGEWVHGETLDSSTDYASYYPYDKIPGILQGKKYEIEVLVWEWDADDEVFRSTTASYTVRMFAPLTVDYGKKGTGVTGYVELTRHYFDGQSINVDGRVNAYNGTDNLCNARSWFRHTEYESAASNAPPTGWSVQDPPTDNPPRTEVASGKSYSNSGSSYISYYVGGLILEGEFYYLNPHIHLEVSGNGKTDVWHEAGTMINTFGKDDNP